MSELTHCFTDNQQTLYDKAWAIVPRYLSSDADFGHAVWEFCERLENNCCTINDIIRYWLFITSKDTVPNRDIAAIYRGMYAHQFIEIMEVLTPPEFYAEFKTRLESHRDTPK